MCVSLGTLAISMYAPSDQPDVSIPSTRTIFTVPAHRVQVIDGDTIRIGQEKFRLVGWDTPEKFGRERCAQEKRMGEQASREARRIFRHADELTLVRQGVDKYGRTLARWRVDGRDYGELLWSKQLAKPWNYPAQAKPKWCATS